MSDNLTNEELSNGIIISYKWFKFVIPIIIATFTFMIWGYTTYSTSRTKLVENIVETVESKHNQTWSTEISDLKRKDEQLNDLYYILQKNYDNLENHMKAQEIKDTERWNEIKDIMLQVQTNLDSQKYFTDTTIIYNINKQVWKIENTPSDVKPDDLKKVLADYAYLSAKAKTPDVDVQFTKIFNYLRDNIVVKK